MREWFDTACKAHVNFFFLKNSWWKRSFGNHWKHCSLCHWKGHYENLEKLSNFLLIFWRNLFSDLKFVQKRHLPKMVYTSTVRKKIHASIVKKKGTCSTEVFEWSMRSAIFQSLWISSYAPEVSYVLNSLTFLCQICQSHSSTWK